MNSHDLLITLLVLSIVAMQVWVFLQFFRRIKLFREIFPGVNSFKTVKVLIPLDRIADITPEEILQNLSMYTNILPPAQEDNYGDDAADEIWMRKGNEEIKVPVDLVDDYGGKGWMRIEASAAE